MSIKKEKISFVMKQYGDYSGVDKLEERIAALEFALTEHKYGVDSQHISRQLVQHLANRIARLEDMLGLPAAPQKAE